MNAHDLAGGQTLWIDLVLALYGGSMIETPFTIVMTYEQIQTKMNCAVTHQRCSYF